MMEEWVKEISAHGRQWLDEDEVQKLADVSDHDWAFWCIFNLDHNKVPINPAATKRMVPEWNEVHRLISKGRYGARGPFLPASGGKRTTSCNLVTRRAPGRSASEGWYFIALP